jgi:lipoprotein-anchoring transpeptidase ErfK/SrfK
VTIDALEIAGTLLEPIDPGVVTVQQSDSHLYRKGEWESREASEASGGSALHSSTAKASMTLRFKGTSVAWLGRRTPQGGSAEVLLDGKRVATVGTAGDEREQVVLWAANGLRRKVHTLTVRVTSHPSAPATTGADVDVDAFAVRGSVLKAYRPTPFHYPWSTYILIDKSDYRLYWIKDGLLVKSYPIAHGKRWGLTPPRVWRVGQKYPHTGGVYGPRKMRLFKRVRTRHGYAYVRTRYGIHGTNQPWVIGTMASHGCIRMYNRDVRDLYPRVPMHTIVITRD